MTPRAVRVMLVTALLLGIVLAHVLGGNIWAAIAISLVLWAVYWLAGHSVSSHKEEEK